MSIQYYTLPQNTSGAVNIPIFNTPTPLAFITVTPGPGNDIGSVRANIGWQALTGRTTQVIFKIWRGAWYRSNCLQRPGQCGKFF